jgi:hypothetical protein
MSATHYIFAEQKRMFLKLFGDIQKKLLNLSNNYRTLKFEWIIEIRPSNIRQA